MMSPLSIAAAIPAYDAEAWVGAVVAGTRRQIEHVLVVDDGSTDATGVAARSAGAQVLTFPENRGKGCALRAAFDHLFGRGFNAVVTLDADGQHLPEEISKLVQACGPEVDLVMGTRNHQFSEMGAVRRASNRLSSRAISIIAGATLADIQTGFRVYSRRLIESTRFPESRFDAESAVVVRAVRRGFGVVAVPVRSGQVDGRETSHYRPIIDSLRIAASVVRARMERTS